MKRILASILLLTFVAVGTAQAGGAKEIALGALYGTSLGVLGGGTALVFAGNADKVYPQYLMIGGGVGFACGVVFGILVPADTEEPSAFLNIDTRRPAFRAQPLALLPDVGWGHPKAGLTAHARLLKLNF